VADKSVFISSCSRRQLARRRQTRAAFRSQILIALVVLVALVGGFVAGHGGV
jgi:hypothetical protein